MEERGIKGHDKVTPDLDLGTEYGGNHGILYTFQAAFSVCRVNASSVERFRLLIVASRFSELIDNCM